jgi:hypothetical protein
MDTTFDRKLMTEEKTLFGIEKSEGKEEWLTPPEIIAALGPFDLDPCSPIKRPWPTAQEHYTIEDDGLHREWHGRVWCNPPYGNKTGQWLAKCARHQNAIALTFARTETRMFFDCVWPWAHAVLFLEGRIHFYHVTGKRGGAAGAPSILIAYGSANAERLLSSRLKGKAIRLSDGS